jgi:hypothetical protein
VAALERYVSVKQMPAASKAWPMAFSVATIGSFRPFKTQNFAYAHQVTAFHRRLLRSSSCNQRLPKHI